MDIFLFFSLYHYHWWLVLDSPIGFQVFYSYFYPSFIVARGLSNLNGIDLGGNLTSIRCRGGSMGFLGRFRY